MDLNISANKMDHRSDYRMTHNPPSHSHNIPLIELQGDLYAILQTANILASRFQQGMIATDFYFRRMKQFHVELITLQQHLQQRGKTLAEIQQRLPRSESLIGIIQTLSGFADMHFDKIAQQWQIDPFQLATATSQITSKFITLLDYLHLVENIEEPFFIQLLEELTEELVPWQCFYFILNEIRFLINDVKSLFLKVHQESNLNAIEAENFIQTPMIQNELRNLEDRLFHIFQTFQENLRNTSK